MSGCVYQNGNLKLIKRSNIFHVYGTIDGRRIRQTTNTGNLEQARAKLDAIVSEFDMVWRYPSEKSSWHSIAGKVWRRHRHGATKRGIPFVISESQVFALMHENQYHCAVSGIPLSPAPGNGQSYNPWAPSLDRIENLQGYSIDNCRVVCLIANLAMNRFGYDSLQRLSKGVVRSCRPVLETKVTQN